MKTTAIFAAVVAALVAFTSYDYWSSMQKDAAKKSEKQIVKLKREDLTHIEVTGRFALERTDGRWNFVSPLQESADQQAVFSLLDSLYGQSISQTVGQGDFAKYGLEKPQFDLLLKTANASEILHVGTIKAFDGSLYGHIEGEPNVVLMSSAWDVILTKPIDELRDKKLYRGDMKAEFDSLSVKGNDSFEIRREGEGYVFTGKAALPPLAANVHAWVEQVKALRGVQFIEPKGKFKADTWITLRKAEAKDFVISLMHDPDHEGQSYLTSSDIPAGQHLLIGKVGLEHVLVGQDVFYDKRAPFTFDQTQVASMTFLDATKAKETSAAVDPKDPFLAQLKLLEAVRFLGPADREQKNSLSHLKLLKSDGSLVFEMWWGKPVVEKEFGDRPEMRYLPVMTSASKLVVGVPEKQIAALANGASATPKKEK